MPEGLGCNFLKKWGEWIRTLKFISCEVLVIKYYDTTGMPSMD